ncbi:MAG: hypothetical protein ABIW84_03035 [Ilumatobacteraceae bacterium]
MTDPGLLERVGLRPGEVVRFRRDAGRGQRARWMSGHLAGMNPDGSITLHDVARGAARSLRPDRLEVRRPGRRGRLTWQNVGVVAVTWEQLELW